MSYMTHIYVTYVEALEPSAQVLELFWYVVPLKNHGVQTLELFYNLLASEFYPICKSAHICEHLCRGPMTSWGKNLSEEPATDDFKTFSGLCHILVF